MRKTPKNYAGYFRPHIGKIILSFTLSGFATAASFATTHVLSTFVDELSLADSFKSLWPLIVFWLAIELVSKLANHSSSKVILNTKVSIQKELKWTLARMLADSSSESVSKNDPVSLAESACGDVNLYIDAIHSIYGEFFSIILGIAALTYTIVYSVELFFMFIISFAMILVAQFFMVKKMVESQSKARTASLDTKSLWVQIIQAFSDIKVQSLAQGIKPHLSEAMDREVKENIRAQEILIDNSLISEVMSLIAQTLFLVFAGILVLSSKLTFANFVAIFMYKGYIYGLVGATLRMVKFKSQLDTAMKRMNAIFHYESVSKEVWGKARLANPSGNISIKNLCVNYRNVNVIDQLSVELPARNFIGIVGDSGCGKSTLLKVLVRAIDSYSGSIQLDGFELSALSEYSLRRAITMAPQSPFLFDFSIKQNMLLADPNASDEQIWEALKLSAAYQFVLEKGGLDTILTPKELSGGQKQRLALARMVLRGGKIILMDESTSALDGESQSHIIQTARVAADTGRTIVLVAHRVSTLKNADLILLMDDGKIIAQGTYAELYKNSEKFRRLANLG